MIIKTITLSIAVFFTFMFFAECILKGIDTVKNKKRNTIKSTIPATISWVLFYLTTQL